MLRAVIIQTANLAFGTLCVTLWASGQATSGNLAIKVVAEVQTRAFKDGHETLRLAPADRVVPGDEVVYTLEIRNVGAAAIRAPTVTNPVPAHMAYLADSATGPGAEVSFSVDGGHDFERPENLRVVDAEGHLRQANCKDYTHIRWKLRNTIKSNSVAFARFRAVVK